MRYRYTFDATIDGKTYKDFELMRDTPNEHDSIKDHWGKHKGWIVTNVTLHEPNN